MKPVQNDYYSAHQTVMLLLPWYVNHTLRDAELKEVKEHLSYCLTCKREVSSLQKLAQKVKQPGAIDTAEQAAFAQLKKRLQPQPAAEATVSFAAHKAAKQPTFRAWTWSRPALALAAGVLVVLIIPNYGTLKSAINADYRTLSEGKPVIVPPNEIHVVFADTLTLTQIDALLAPFSGRVIGEPTEQLVYTVRFEQIHSKATLLNHLSQLKKHPQVIFAEPAHTLLSPASVKSMPQ